MVEPGAARLAAERRLEAADRPRCARRSATRSAPGARRRSSSQANRDFHLALVEGTGNPQLVQFMEHVWIGRIGATLYEARLDPSGLDADHDAHKSIADAIEAGDADAGRAARRAATSSARWSCCSTELTLVVSRRGRALADLQRLQVGVEVERVVAALAADAADPDAAEGRGEVADEEGVDPGGAGADRAPDALGALGSSAVQTIAESP